MKIASSLKFAERSREGALTIGESLSIIKNAGFVGVEVDLSRGIGGAALAYYVIAIIAALLPKRRFWR